MEKVECKIQFKTADSIHVGQMHKIEESVFPVPWSYESIAQDVCEHEIAVYIVGLCKDEVVSYAGLWHVLEESHVTNIAVKKGYRKRGIGKKTINILLDAARKLDVKTVTLEVRESNIAAIGLYEKVGFFKAGRRKKYYTDNFEDAIIMNKVL
ncbi:MAG: ribosomal protein S18-alanine N-acetyltransferase [Clostridiales bacterium]|nr:ribosomal protein S18-alanine N-acetyltransferase [Clostridiales bacterium]